MTYLVLAAITAGFALIPLPLFPSWIVVAYLVVEYDLRLWWAIPIGAFGTMVGRVGLVAISRVAGERMLGRWSRGNMQYLHAKLESAGGNLGIAVLLAASPPPAGVLFIVAGLVRVHLWLVAVSVFVGRIIGYAISVGGASLAAAALASQLRGAFGPWAAVIAIVIVLGVLLLFLRLDYRALFEDRRLRWNFRRKRDDDMPGGA